MYRLGWTVISWVSSYVWVWAWLAVCVSPYQYFPSSNLLDFCLSLLPCEPQCPTAISTCSITVPFHLPLPSCVACVVHVARFKFVWASVCACVCVCVCVFTSVLDPATCLWHSLWHQFLVFSWIKLYILLFLLLQPVKYSAPKPNAINSSSSRDMRLGLLFGPLFLCSFNVFLKNHQFNRLYSGIRNLRLNIIGRPFIVALGEVLMLPKHIGSFLSQPRAQT